MRIKRKRKNVKPVLDTSTQHDKIQYNDRKRCADNAEIDGRKKHAVYARRITDKNAQAYVYFRKREPDDTQNARLIQRGFYDSRAGSC